MKESWGPLPRVGPFREDAFESELHSERTATVLGIALGVTFTMCFATGLISHLIQHPPGWFSWPSRPAGLYRFTQGLHVATGIASIPLLLGKLWCVYPKLFRWPPVVGALHGLERALLLPLVGGSLFMVFSGVASISRWNPYPFSFPTAHYWVAWITIGALVVHIGAKSVEVVPALREADPPEQGPPEQREAMSRRGFFAVLASAAGALTLVTIGQTLSPLERLGLLAPRRPSVGPQGFPVNKTAVSARVSEVATSPDYALEVVAGGSSRVFSLADLRAMQQREATLPIACVDGWSASVPWKGVSLASLLGSVGAPTGGSVRVESLQDQTKAYSSVELDPSHAWDPDTLLALECRGEPLHIDHGYPVRLIAPNNPGVMQTKWVGRVVVL